MSDLTSRQDAIDALEALVDKDTNVPSNDCISRQAAIDAIHCKITVTGRQNAELVAATMSAFVDRIRALPSAQPERPKGEWIHIRDEEDGNALYECSVCHKGEVHVPIVEVSYCWNCGADMRGEQDG